MHANVLVFLPGQRDPPRALATAADRAPVRGAAEGSLARPQLLGQKHEIGRRMSNITASCVRSCLPVASGHEGSRGGRDTVRLDMPSVSGHAARQSVGSLAEAWRLLHRRRAEAVTLSTRGLARARPRVSAPARRWRMIRACGAIFPWAPSRSCLLTWRDRLSRRDTSLVSRHGRVSLRLGPRLVRTAATSPLRPAAAGSPDRASGRTRRTSIYRDASTSSALA